MDVAAVRRAVLVQQPPHRRDVAQVEQLELRHDLALAHREVQPLDELPRVHEDVGAEVDRAAGEAGAVRVGVEHAEPGVVRVGDRAAGGDLYDEVGGLAHRLDGGA